jgi:hypothetical protein
MISGSDPSLTKVRHSVLAKKEIVSEMKKLSVKRSAKKEREQ